jgi:predicted DNA-binding ribbon-helix-helix protein
VVAPDRRLMSDAEAMLSQLLHYRRRAMKSPVVKRSIVIAGHRTSVSLEDAFWQGLNEIANGPDITLSDLVTAIDSERRHANLSSAIRIVVLDFYRNRLSRPAGHAGSGGIEHVGRVGDREIHPPSQKLRRASEQTR